jgi:hypothetical protein
VDGVYDAGALELHPHAIVAGTWKSKIELNLRGSVGDKRSVCIMSIRSSLAASMCPQAPRYFSSPSPGVILNRIEVFRPATAAGPEVIASSTFMF